MTSPPGLVFPSAKDGQTQPASPQPRAGGVRKSSKHKHLVGVSLLCAVALGFAGPGCAGESTVTPPDAPTPASEPRAELTIKVSLPRAAACDEVFDLELYRGRGIEMIAWEPGKGCTARRAKVRYLPRAIDRAVLIDAIKKLVTELEVMSG